jgi:hypothetical protein
LRRIDRFCKDPVRTQASVLRRLLRTAARTEWGKRFAFADLARQEDVVGAYQERVPLQDYEAFREDILRMRRGEHDILWPGQVSRFATSAGTSAAAKNTPASDALIRANIRLVAGAILSYLAETGHVDCLRGLPVSLTGHVGEDPSNRSMLVGEISGLAAEFWHEGKRIRRSLTRHRSLPREVHRIPDWDQKLDAIADYAVGEDVRLMAAVPSWGLQLFDRLIERYNHRHGTTVDTVGEIWPNLRLILAGGVPLRAYRELLERRIGLPRVDFLEMYGASEAPLAFQSSLMDPALLLHLDNGIFFEFLRHDEFGSCTPRRHTLADVVPGTAYVPVVSTCGGLWAYQLGDIVRFTQVTPHKIVVVGRTVEMLDSYGEFVSAEQARDALNHAGAATGLKFAEFHGVFCPASQGLRHCHQWLIEFDKRPDDVSAFAESLDRRLREINPMYDSCRREKGFGRPHVVALPRGAFYEYRKTEHGKIGAQTKVPCLSDDRGFADGVLQFARVASDNGTTPRPPV